MARIASGVLAWWPGTDASIPSGWTRKTSMDTRFSKGTAVSVNPDVTGGAATHAHTSPSHSHSVASHTHAISGRSSTATHEVNDAERAGSAVIDFSLTHSHSTSGTSGSVAANASGVATWQSTSSDLSFFKMILIESDGTPIGFPNSSVAFYDAASAPSGWTQHSGSEGRFVKGADAAGDGGGTGGGGSHTHTTDAHSHSIDSHSHAAGSLDFLALGTLAATNPGTLKAKRAHQHGISVAGGATSPGGSSDASASTGGTSYEPSFHTLLAVENTSGGARATARVIAMWLGTLASIPTRWLLCDGSSGTPDLRDRFIKCAAVGGGDVGTTGGTNGHAHGDPAGHTHTQGHSHTVTATDPGLQASSSQDQNTDAISGHTHTRESTTTSPSAASAAQTVDSTADTQPPFRTVAYIQFQGAARRAPIYF